MGGARRRSCCGMSGRRCGCCGGRTGGGRRVERQDRATDVDLVVVRERRGRGEAAAVEAGAVAGGVVECPGGTRADQPRVDAGDLVVGGKADVGVGGAAEGDLVGGGGQGPALCAEREREFRFHQYPTRQPTSSARFCLSDPFPVQGPHPDETRNTSALRRYGDLTGRSAVPRRCSPELTKCHAWFAIDEAGAGDRAGTAAVLGVRLAQAGAKRELGPVVRVQ